MATYKIVDTEQLDSDITSVADAIRLKGNTTDELSWPDGFVSGIENISNGVIVKYDSGTFTTKEGGANISVNCGFSPDIIYITYGDKYYGEFISASISFFAKSYGTIMNVSMWMSYLDSYVDFTSNQTDTGFVIGAYYYDYNTDETVSLCDTFSYIAVKFT